MRGWEWEGVWRSWTEPGRGRKKTKRRERVGTKRQGRQDKAGGRGTDETHRVKSEARRGGGGVGTAGENKVLRFCYNVGIITFFVDFLEKIVYTSPIYVYMGGAYLCIY